MKKLHSSAASHCAWQQPWKEAWLSRGKCVPTPEEGARRAKSERGDPAKGGKTPIPVPLPEFSISRGTNKSKLGVQQPPRRTIPQRGAQPQAPEARAGRLRRSPRRRHTKSQNGCPQEARTAQLVRVGEQASAGKGKEDSRKRRGQVQRAPSHTGSSYSHPFP